MGSASFDIPGKTPLFAKISQYTYFCLEKI